MAALVNTLPLSRDQCSTATTVMSATDPSPRRPSEKRARPVEEASPNKTQSKKKPSTTCKNGKLGLSKSQKAFLSQYHESKGDATNATDRSSSNLSNIVCVKKCTKSSSTQEVDDKVARRIQVTIPADKRPVIRRRKKLTNIRTGRRNDDHGGGGRWTKKEDELLRQAVQKVGAKNWKKISVEFMHSKRSDVQCLHRWQKVLRPGLVKGPWTTEEDETIIRCVNAGISKWSEIAERISGRIGKQCRERWFNHLDPNIKKGPWTDDEDRILLDAQMKLGNRWSKIAELLQGRSENSVKNRWNSAMRRKYQGRALGKNEKRVLTAKDMKNTKAFAQASRRRSRSRNESSGDASCSKATHSTSTTSSGVDKGNVRSSSKSKTKVSNKAKIKVAFHSNLENRQRKSRKVSTKRSYKSGTSAKRNESNKGKPIDKTKAQRTECKRNISCMDGRPKTMISTTSIGKELCHQLMFDPTTVTDKKNNSAIRRQKNSTESVEQSYTDKDSNANRSRTTPLIDGTHMSASLRSDESPTRRSAVDLFDDFDLSSTSFNETDCGTFKSKSLPLSKMPIKALLRAERISDTTTTNTNGLALHRSASESHIIQRRTTIPPLQISGKRIQKIIGHQRNPIGDRTELLKLEEKTDHTLKRHKSLSSLGPDAPHTRLKAAKSPCLARESIEDPLASVVPNHDHTKILSGLLFPHEPNSRCLSTISKESVSASVTCSSPMKKGDHECNGTKQSLLAAMRLSDREKRLMYESFILGAVNGQTNMTPSNLESKTCESYVIDDDDDGNGDANAVLGTCGVLPSRQLSPFPYGGLDIGVAPLKKEKEGIQLTDKERSILAQALASSSNELLDEVTERFGGVHVQTNMDLHQLRTNFHSDGTLENSTNKSSCKNRGEMCQPMSARGSSSHVLYDSTPSIDILHDLSNELGMSTFTTHGDDILSSMSLSFKNMSLDDSRARMETAGSVATRTSLILDESKQMAPFFACGKSRDLSLLMESI